MGPGDLKTITIVNSLLFISSFLPPPPPSTQSLLKDLFYLVLGQALKIYVYLLTYLFLFGCARSQSQHAGSLVEAYGIQFPAQGSNPGPLHWEPRVLATEPPGKSLGSGFYFPLVVDNIS